MATVTVNINARPYQIACADGQQDHVRRLAAEIDRRVRDLVATVGQVGDSLLLVMVAMVLADEAADAKARLHGREAGAGALDQAVATAIEMLAARVEGIAERLEKA